MVEKADSGGQPAKFPRAVILIVVFQYAVKFAINTTRGVLPLYLVDILGYDDDEAVVFYHSFVAITFVFSVLGGILADSLLGKFKSILVYSAIFALGLILLSTAAASPLRLPIRTFTIPAVLVAALGYGAIRPCTVAFGGNQFTLPDQAKQLSLLFVLLCVAENLASMSVALVVPVLRKDITCFGELTCYSLTFVLPAALLAVAAVVLFATKRLYRIHEPEGNVVVKVTKCVLHALCQRSKSQEKRRHWLDHANGKYEAKLIEDIKSVSSVLKLLLPLPIFWSLYTAQSSLWLFQASRMDGEILGGYVVKPDQIQLANSLSVVLLVPIFHSYVYPLLAKYCAVNTPLRRITLGCFVTAAAYYVSGLVELNLEPTYAKVPARGLAQARLYNTLDCKVHVALDGREFAVSELDFWQDVDIAASGKRVLTYEADFGNCNISETIPKRVTGQLEVMENQATSWAITETGLAYEFVDRVDKSNSGNPLVRTLIHVGDDLENDVTLDLVSRGQILKEIKLPVELEDTALEEVAHKDYDLQLNGRPVESNVPLKLGGVYTILGRVTRSSVKIHTVTVTRPNSLHIVWVLPQQILIAVAEIMVNVLVMEFAYSQAPSSMKAFLQSFWLFMGFFGNLIVVAITEAHLFERKVFVLFLYAALMTTSATVFGILAKFYTYKKFNNSDPE